jgi:hypothetical protein
MEAASTEVKVDKAEQGVPASGKNEAPMTSLKTRQEDLQSKRDILQRRSDLVQYGGIVLTGVGLMISVALTLQEPGSNILLSPAFYLLYLCGFGILLLLQVPSHHRRIKQYEANIQELGFTIDLQQFAVSPREMRAEKILRLNEFQLRRYYDLNISQNTWVFGLGLCCILLGAAIIGLTLYLVVKVVTTPQEQLVTAALGTVGAVLTNFIAVIYIRMNTATTEHLAAFHTRLVETNQLLLGNLLASRIDDDTKRWETLSQLSLKLVDTGKE